MRAFRDYPFTPRRHAARLPPLDHGMERTRHAVAIAGGGPIGLALALGLANHGVASVLLEADDTVCIGSRATCLSRRTLEIFDRLGVLEPFLRTALPWSSGRSFYRQREVLRLEMAMDDDQRFAPMVNLQQYYLEQFLLDAVEQRSDLIDVRWCSRLSALRSHDEGVDLQVTTPAGDYRMRCGWLVASDGARSTVREALGLKLQGTQYEGRYVIVDIHLPTERPTGRLAWFDPPSNPGATLLMHKQADSIWRIDYQLRADEDPEQAVRAENVIPRVESHLRMIGECEDWHPVWISLYKANALSLERYRHGRVLFAGDAAHLLPIFGVRGVNSGFEDTHNLAWKLAWVERGIAAESLLDTYSEERVHAARRNLAYATKSTEFMTPPSAAFQLMRDAVLTLAEQHEWIRSLISPRQSQAIPYESSRLNAGADTGFANSPAPGHVLLEVPLLWRQQHGEHAAHLTETLGGGFTALSFGNPGSTLQAAARAAIPADIELRWHEVVGGDDSHTIEALVDRSGRLHSLYDARPGTLYLVRPDGHVLGRWRSPAASEVSAAIRNVLEPAA